MPPAPHVAAAIAACGPRPAAQPKRLPGPAAHAAHLSSAVAAARGGSAPGQARLKTAPVQQKPAASRSAGPSPVVQRMRQDDTREELWQLPGFLFSETRGFYHGQAPKNEIQSVGGQVPAKTYLYLGAGDLSAPAAKAKKHKGQQDHQIVATELQTEKGLRQTGGQGFEKNLRKLLKKGHTVAFEVDGTNNVKGVYDRIIFNNPHTGKYGSAESYDHSPDVESISSNMMLLSGLFQAARGHLEHNGLLEITICGFPYVSSTYGQRQHHTFRQGMGLENPFKANAFAQHYGWQVVTVVSKGEQSVRRNNGDWFRATVYKLKFRQL